MKARLLIAMLLGVVLGAGVGPVADYAASRRTYGVDSGAAIDPMVCLQIGMEVLPEIELAKKLGATKVQYIHYVQTAIEVGKLSPEQQRSLNQVLFYFDQIWESADGGFKVVDQCFERAQNEQVKRNSATI
jgi:hypothetical protein